MRTAATTILAAVASAGCLAACSAPSPPTTATTGPVAGGTGPSFDCATAGGDVEKLVCSDRVLSELDRRLAAEYQHAVGAAGSDVARLRSTQNGWVAGRDDCWKADDVRRCVLEAYRTRLVELEIDDPDTVTPPTITYSCPGGRSLTARFYNHADPPAAVLTLGTDSAIVFVEPSGSGARYGRTGVEFWEHQGEVNVDFYGNTFVCRTP